MMSPGDRFSGHHLPAGDIDHIYAAAAAATASASAAASGASGFEPSRPIPLSFGKRIRTAPFIVSYKEKNSISLAVN